MTLLVVFRELDPGCTREWREGGIVGNAALRNQHPQEVFGSMIKSLYVGNLPWSTSQEDLTQLFSPYGEVISARIATDRETGRSRGFGFVEMPTEAADAAIAALSGATYGDRPLTVNEAKPREERPRTFGQRRF